MHDNGGQAGGIMLARNNSSRTPCMLTRPNVSVTVVKPPTIS